MAKKKKAKAPKKEPKKKAAEEELEEDLELSEDDDGLDEESDDLEEDDGLDADEDAEDDADLEEEEEEEAAPLPVHKKKAAEEFAEGETVQSKARKKEAARVKQGQPPVKKEWFEWKLGNTHDPKKGRKLVRYQQTRNGAQSEYVGWEKKIPKSYLKKLRADGMIKE